MFGYITVNQPEMKFKDFALYRSFYCGLCRSLKTRYGLAGQTTLSFDMTFLGILLSSLYEPETEESKTFCLLHPAEKHPTLSNKYVDYAADMNLLLAYYDLRDDWQDEKKLGGLLGSDAIRKSCRKLEAVYPRQSEAVKTYVAELSALEKESSDDLDAVAGLTGRMLSEIFVPEEDLWAPHLRKIGFWLGKFIYLMDAFEDLDKDLKKGRYNPWKNCGESRLEIADKAREILNMMMGECSLAFEHLPLLLYEDILRNILYAGVWCRFEAALKADREAAEKKAAKEGERHGV